MNDKIIYSIPSSTKYGIWYNIFFFIQSFVISQQLIVFRYEKLHGKIWKIDLPNIYFCDNLVATNEYVIVFNNTKGLDEIDGFRYEKYMYVA